jgi:aldose 1-epimerase
LRRARAHGALGIVVFAFCFASVGGGFDVASGSVAVPVAANVKETAFGSMPDGTAVRLFTLTNAAGMEVRAITYGLILVSIKVPDRHGRAADVVVGH